MPRLDLVPATVDLSGAEIELIELQERTHRLDKALEGAADQRWDVCLIDCPPSLGLLTVNALVAANSILVPLQTRILRAGGAQPAAPDGRADPRALQPGAVDPRRRADHVRPPQQLSDQVADDVRACLGKVVFETVIPRNVRLSEAPSHGMPALIYDHRCPGSEAYIALARELIARLPEPRRRRHERPFRQIHASARSGLGRGLLLAAARSRRKSRSRTGEALSAGRSR